MAQTYVNSTTFATGGGAGTHSFAHGLQNADGTKQIPDYYLPEFQADPGSGARVWTISKDDTNLVVGFNTPNNVNLKLTAVYVHSVGRNG